MGSLITALGGLFAAFGPVVNAFQQVTAKPDFIDTVGRIVTKIIVPVFSLFK